MTAIFPQILKWEEKNANRFKYTDYWSVPELVDERFSWSHIFWGWLRFPLGSKWCASHPCILVKVDYTFLLDQKRRATCHVFLTIYISPKYFCYASYRNTSGPDISGWLILQSLITKKDVNVLPQLKLGNAMVKLENWDRPCMYCAGWVTVHLKSSRKLRKSVNSHTISYLKLSAQSIKKKKHIKIEWKVKKNYTFQILTTCKT